MYLENFIDQGRTLTGERAAYAMIGLLIISVEINTCINDM